MGTTQNNTTDHPSRTIERLARQLAASNAERDAALAREAALAEVLDVINRSPADPGPVFDAIPRNAHNLCGAVTGSLQIDQGMHLRAVAAHGFAEDHAALIREPREPDAR